MTPRNLRQEQEPVVVVAERACMELEAATIGDMVVESPKVRPLITPTQVEQVIGLYQTGQLGSRAIAHRTGLSMLQCQHAIKQIKVQAAVLTASTFKAKLSESLQSIIQGHTRHIGEMTRRYIGHQVNVIKLEELDDHDPKRLREEQAALVLVGREITKTNEAFINMIKGMGVPEVIETSSNKNPTPGSTNIKNLEVYPDDAKLLEVDTIASLKRQLKALEAKESKEKANENENK